MDGREVGEAADGVGVEEGVGDEEEEDGEEDEEDII